MDEQIRQHGVFSWSELMTTDLAAANPFYARLFGWSLEDMPMGDASYTVINAGNREVGGMMTTPLEAQGSPPIWGTYVTMDAWTASPGLRWNSISRRLDASDGV